MKDYLTFHKEKRAKGRKTDKYLVRHRYNAEILGEIKFHGAWRQFVFYPETETYFAWAASATSGLLSLFAIERFNFAELAYPLYLFIFDTLVLLLVLKILRRKVV